MVNLCASALDHSRFSPPSESYITHYWEPPSGLNGIEKDLSDEAINLARFKTATLLESRTTIESGTTGLRTWLAGFFLSQYLILHPGDIHFRSISPPGKLTDHARVDSIKTNSGAGLGGWLPRDHRRKPPENIWLWDITSGSLDVRYR